MSFSYDVKNELCKIRPSGCCRYAECYGMMLLGRSFSNEKISIITENEEVANKYVSLIRICFDAATETTVSGKSRDMFNIRVRGIGNRKKIRTTFLSGNETALCRDAIRKECCIAAFLRGAFLTCGTISDPQKEYRLEFVVNSLNIAKELAGIITSRGILSSVQHRGTQAIVCFKDSDKIEDLLTFIGATSYTLKLMNVKIYKDMRNKVNRLSNCETANITKTVNASVLQKKAINHLKEEGIFALLDDDLKQVACLRLENNDASLNELAVLSKGRFSRSGIDRRLKKLCDLYYKR